MQLVVQLEKRRFIIDMEIYRTTQVLVRGMKMGFKSVALIFNPLTKISQQRICWLKLL